MKQRTEDDKNKRQLFQRRKRNFFQFGSSALNNEE